jgi:trehalose 6-phosphate synthase
LQTTQDVENLGRYFTDQGGQSRRAPGVFEIDGRKVAIHAFPVSIATAIYARAARNSVRSRMVKELRDSLAGKRLILGVDRLDYSKGIPHRIRAFGQFLDKYPEWLGKVTFLQVTPKSRTAVPEYAAMNQEINGLVGQINGRHGDTAWTPIRYVNRSYSRAALAGLYRSAQVALVTPLRDGMNLVAKEYVAAQDPEDPGVLVLSQFAGAAQELDGALIVNPHETESMVEAIRNALEMPLLDRRERHHRMFEHLAANDIDRWAERFLSALAGSRKQPGLLKGFQRLFAQNA